MKKFIDRINELSTLEKQYSRSGSSFVVIYGRRRVGKTTLITEFISNKPAVFFLATEESESSNRKSLKNRIAEFTNNVLLKSVNIEEWDVLFTEFVKKPETAKKILVIDEFQYLCKANRSFSSLLQRIWETILKDENIMLILCGSHMSMMESETLNYSSPLYGRRTAQILLRQISFHFYREFYPNRSEEELCQFYSVTGGVPKYIEQFEAYLNIYEAIKENILDRNSFLYDEPNFLLRNELGEVGTYYSIIKTIAAGYRKLSKIAENMEEKQSSISAYLQTLISLDIIEREVPITEERPDKSKKGLYRIKDNYILFWFKFIYPNISLIESGHADAVLEQIRQNLIVNHTAHIYEDICLDKLRTINGSETVGCFYNQIGRWWDNKNEIDIVGINTTGNEIIFGECKFRQKKMDTDVLEELIQKAATVTWKKDNRKEQYILFSISGYTNELVQLAENRKNVILM